MSTYTGIAVALIVIGAVMLAAPQRLRNAFLHPGYGSCYRCERTWDVVDSHTTPAGQTPIKVAIGSGEWTDTFAESGCFPLCKGCWSALGTPEARLPYYRKLVDDWSKNDRPTDEPSEKRWPAIRAAVLAGK